MLAACYQDHTSSSCKTPPCLTPAAAAAAATVLNTVQLHQLQLSSHVPLQAAMRQRCPGCRKPRAFFCYDCLVPLMQGMPSFTALPVDIHIVMHGESNAQATGTHAAVLAPQCVTLWRHNDGTSHHRRQPASKLQLPDWDPQSTAVLYPESPETPVVGLWGRLEQHGSGRQEDKQHRHQQGQGQNEGVWNARTRQVSEHQTQQQPAAELLLLSALQQLACGDARAAPCGAGGCSPSCGCSCGRSCRSDAQQHPGCHAAATGATGAAVSAATSSSCADAAGSQCRSTTSGGTSSSPAGSSSDSSGQQPSGFPYKSIVILEGSWAKARTLLKHPKLAALPRLQLPPTVRSLFWRRGTGSFRAAVDSGVCTIEALYLLCRQLQPQPEACWDDLLWLWVYQRQLVQQRGSHQTRREMQLNYEAACGAA